ncbi:MAG TPA: NAD(P)H-hydrate dehydratase [Burkholderiales bacterium]|nr:NAD(P)H-hydrate dehydratase [Burkholderiales bacterium]
MTFSSAVYVPICRRAEIRAIEGKAGPGLMERAGLAAAQIARDLNVNHGHGVLVVAGPGNNGGDAFVAARHLKAWRDRIEVVFAGDAAKLSAEARSAFDAWRDGGGSVMTTIPDGRRWDLVVDGLFGIGLQRALDGKFAALVQAINAIDAPVLALDVPSGLDADTGRVPGGAVQAEHTATFIALKPGLLTLDGPDYCGQIHLCPLDIDSAVLGAPRGTTIGDDVIRNILPTRRNNSHKGDYGDVGILGGAHGMAGAALLAARAALKLGAGRVYAGLLDGAPPYDPAQPELMLRSADELLKLPLNCLAIGPGLGQSPDAFQLVGAALQTAAPLIIDADALNLIAAAEKLRDAVKRRTASTVLTPHPAEAARLLGCTTAEVQADRVSTACEIAARYRACTVLKGAGSVCAMPDGAWRINTTGNPGMASAGMGDALTGMIAALIAQDAAAEQALPAAVHLHGAAADDLAANGAGPVGITASEVITAARARLNHR